MFLPHVSIVIHLNIQSSRFFPRFAGNIPIIMGKIVENFQSKGQINRFHVLMCPVENCGQNINGLNEGQKNDRLIY